MRRLLVVLCGLSLGGCATLDHGLIDDMQVVTSPPGATVSSSNGTVCTSPCVVSGPRREVISITVAKPGYVTQTLVADAKPDTNAIAAAASLTATPDVLGRVIDVQDGTYYGHVPKAFVVKLEPGS